MSTMKVKGGKPMKGLKNKLKPKLKHKKRSNKPKSQLTTTIDVADDDSFDEANSVKNQNNAKRPKLTQNGIASTKKKNNKNATINNAKEKVQDVTLEDDDFTDLDDDEDENEEMTGLNKDTLERLKQKDPEFYKYLQQHDKELLDFDDDEANEDILDDASPDEEKNDEAKDNEEDDKITLNKVKQWRKVLQSQSSKAEDLNAIKSIIKAFRKTVNQTTDNNENFSPNLMSMLNPSVFNAIINTVLVDLLPSLLRYLRLQNVLKSSKPCTEPDEGEMGGDNQEANQIISNRGNFYDPRRSRNWKRVQSSVKIYLTDVLKMLSSLSADARSSFERHILELTPFFNAFPHLIKRLIKRAIDEWCGVGGSEDRNRVLAYLVLHRTIRVIQSNDHLTSNERQSMVNQILRKLYMSYVAVARNTNESTIAQISFMKNSLVELYRLDDQLAYQHAFIFIRQLAINLRGSLILKEKNSLKTVYNWQFVHSVLLWSQLICSAHNQTDVLDPLISPLVMVITGTIKLLPTIKFIPLRFHLIRTLIKLSTETGHFIPVLRYFLEIYSLFDPNKVQKHSSNKTISNKNKKSDQKDSKKVEKEGKSKSVKFTSKAINFEVMLKVSKEQTTEIEFVQKVFDKFYTNCLQYVASQSASIAFPELVTIFLHQSRKFIQTIRFPRERTLMKQLMDKIQENSNYIFQKRKSVRYSIQETTNITAWERQIRQSESSPLAKFNKQLKAFKASNACKNSDSVDVFDSMDKIVQEKYCAEIKDRTFDVESDLKKQITKKKDSKLSDEEDEMEMEFDEDDEQMDDLNDDELAQLGEDGEEDDLDEEIEFEENDEVELTEEEFAKLQKKIEKEEKKLKNLKDEDSEQKDGESSGAKKRKKKNKNKNKKKPRKLNNDLQLEGAFDMSSDEDND